MKKLLHSFLLLFTFLLALNANAQQGQANIWYFGINAGIDFSDPTNPIAVPGILSSANIGGDLEAASTVCDADGNYLFAVIGNKIYDGAKVASGIILPTDFGTSQGNLIIPNPAAPNKFFVLTTPYSSSSCVKGIPSYTAVTVTGTGAGNIVVGPLVNLPETGITEGQAVIAKSDGSGYWWVLHRKGSNTFAVYEVTSTGNFVFKKDISPVGSPSLICNAPFNYEEITVLKTNSCDTQLAMSTPFTGVSLFDLDVKTNANDITLTFKNNISTSVIAEPYGLEFSPNGQYLYVSKGIAMQTPTLYKLPITSGNLGTPVVLGTLAGSIRGGHLQMASNGNIYAASQANWNPVGNGGNPLYIGEISSPNTGGVFDKNKIAITTNGAYSGMSLPYIFKSFLNKLGNIALDGVLLRSTGNATCKGTTKMLSLNLTNPSSTNPQWYVNNVLAGTGNSIAYTFNTTGKNTIRVDITDNCGVPASMNANITVEDYITANASISNCAGGTVTLTGTGSPVGGYRWYTDNAGVKGTFISAGPTFTASPYTSYWVEPTGILYSPIGNTGGSVSSQASTGIPGSNVTGFVVLSTAFLSTVKTMPFEFSSVCTAAVNWELRSGSSTGTLIKSGSTPGSTCSSRLIVVNTLLPAGNYFFVWVGGGKVSDGNTKTTSPNALSNTVASIAGTTVFGTPYNGPFSDFVFTSEFLCKTSSKIDVPGCCTPPLISVQPAPKTACVGTNTSFTAISQTPGTTVQWQESMDGGANWLNLFNTNNYAGVTTITFTIFNTSLSQNNRRYRAVFSSFTCNLPTVTIAATLTVTALPISKTSITGATISANLGGATYKWFNCTNTSTILATTQSYTPTSSGNYGVVVTKNGCDSTSACKFVDLTITDISNTKFTENTVKIFPNPASDFIQIENEESIVGSIKISDLQGNLVIEKEITEKVSMISTENMTNGIYIVNVKSDSINETQKLVIVR